MDPQLAHREKKTSSMGTLVQLLGVVLFLVLAVAAFPLGLMLGSLLGCILLIKGHSLAVYWACGACGERLPSRTVSLCKGCRSRLVSEQELRRAQRCLSAHPCSILDG